MIIIVITALVVLNWGRWGGGGRACPPLPLPWEAPRVHRRQRKWAGPGLSPLTQSCPNLGRREREGSFREPPPALPGTARPAAALPGRGAGGGTGHTRLPGHPRHHHPSRDPHPRTPHLKSFPVPHRSRDAPRAFPVLRRPPGTPLPRTGGGQPGPLSPALSVKPRPPPLNPAPRAVVPLQRDPPAPSPALNQTTPL